MDQVAVLGTERSTVDLVTSLFERQGIEATRIDDCAETTGIVSDIPYLLAVVCPTTIDDDDLRLNSRLLAAFVGTPAVFAVRTPSLEIALQAVRLGAFDVLILPPKEEVLRDLITRARLYRQSMVVQRLSTLSQFSGWFAHEIRNPLTGILSSAQLSVESVTPTDRIQRYLKIIVEEGSRMEQFLRRVTELGRPARGPLVPASLSAVVERALVHAAPRLKAQNIRLQRRLDPQLPKVRIDVARVESAISRMIASAIEAMPEDGTMTVMTGYRAGERMIECEVTDSNLSAAQERQRQLFGPFVSLRLRETGLGLAFALQTFAEYGGDVSLHTDSGQGGSILARLPLNGSWEASNGSDSHCR